MGLNVNSSIRVWTRGFATGMFLQLAIGPVFIYLLNITLLSGMASGISAVLAVTVVDFLYIGLAIAGIGRILQAAQLRFFFNTVSSLVLVVFGVMLIHKGMTLFQREGAGLRVITMTPLSAFVSLFILTISSPMTILFWSTILTAKAMEYSLNRSELVVFGVAAGSATLCFLGSTVVLLSLFRIHPPLQIIRILNIIIGSALVMFAVYRAGKMFSGSGKKGPVR